MRRAATFVAFAFFLAACPRIEAVARLPSPCTPAQCGAEVTVRTGLAKGTALTSRECDQVCAGVWCDAIPIARNASSGREGCALIASDTVLCTAVAYDCGYTFPCSAAGRCPVGQCRRAGDQCCQASVPECGDGLSCAQCPAPDSRCSLSACANFKACGGRLDTEPSASICADADGGVDPQFDLVQFCPNACNAQHAGARVEQCVGDAGVEDAGVGTCIDACAESRVDCEKRCSRSSYRECTSCAAGCGVAFGQCRRACP